MTGSSCCCSHFCPRHSKTFLPAADSEPWDSSPAHKSATHDIADKKSAADEYKSEYQQQPSKYNADKSANNEQFINADTVSSNNQQKAADLRLHQQLADDLNKQDTVIRTEPAFSRPTQQSYSSLQPDINLLETAFNLQGKTNSLREQTNSLPEQAISLREPSNSLQEPANSLPEPANSLREQANILREPSNSLPEPATINISLVTKQLTSPIIDL